MRFAFRNGFAIVETSCRQQEFHATGMNYRLSANKKLQQSNRGNKKGKEKEKRVDEIIRHKGHCIRYSARNRQSCRCRYEIFVSSAAEMASRGTAARALTT
jgi:hypothetical protein